MIILLELSFNTEHGYKSLTRLKMANELVYKSVEEVLHLLLLGFEISLEKL